MLIDTTFDVRTDAGGRDPDRYSATLRRYHRLLWSKPLPGGAMLIPRMEREVVPDIVEVEVAVPRLRSAAW